MITFEQSTILIAILYSIATLCGITGIILRQSWLRKFACICTTGSFLLQTLDMSRGMHTMLPGGLSWGVYLQLLAWFILLCSFFGAWRTKHSTPIIFTTPLVLMLFLLSLRVFKMQVALPQSLNGTFYTLHIGSLYLSIALLALAFIVGIIFLYVERKIKNKTPLTGFLKDLPALNMLDRLNFLTVLLGFPLFTIGIVSGFIWASNTWGKTIHGDPKEIVSLFIWGLFAWLFYIRIVQRRSGRKPALLSVWLFILSIFSISIVNTFMKTYHSFIL